MITIILNHHNKYAEVDMPAMYEKLQLALWKLGLDRVPEKYTLVFCFTGILLKTHST